MLFTLLLRLFQLWSPETLFGWVLCPFDTPPPCFIFLSFLFNTSVLKDVWAHLVYFLPQRRTQSFLQGEMALFFYFFGHVPLHSGS